MVVRTRFAAQDLRAFVARALVAMDVSSEDAALVGEVLVTSDTRGIESHGVARLESFYVDRIRDGQVDPKATSTVVRESPTALAIDARNGLGHPVSVRTMRRTVEKAREIGMAVSTVRNSNHYGIAGYYAMLAMEADCIGISSTNAGRLAVPTGGRDLMLGTNPFAYAIPANDGDAFVLDMATTTVALGKLEIAKRLGKKLIPGWAVDASGAMTTDPDAGMGGAVLPLGGFGTENGGHKGFGLGLLAEMLCAVLGGGVLVPDMPPRTGALNGGITSHFFAAIRIDAFRDVAEFKTDVSRELAAFRTSAPAPGSEGVLVAGDPERAKSDEQLRNGVALDPVVVASLARVAEKTGVAPVQSLRS
jgi:L-2-hydroxycarboxylate dehydrogenase (NAD+)